MYRHQNQMQRMNSRARKDDPLVLNNMNQSLTPGSQVKLLRNKKQESNGIKDDESLLCPTPPDGDCSPANVRYVQPINVTVNLNNQIGG